MKRHICSVAAVFAACILPVLAFDAMDVTRDWRCQPLASKSVARLKPAEDECPPPLEDSTEEDKIDALLDDGGIRADATARQSDAPLFTDRSGKASFWLAKSYSLAGLVEQVAEDKYRSQGPEDPANAAKGAFNAWYRKEIAIPADWKGKWTTLEGEIGYIGVALYVNGRRVGVGRPPAFSIDVTPFLEYGGKNTFMLFCSNQGRGTGPGIRYVARDDGGSAASHFFSPVQLRTHASAKLDDVWADTRWRQKRIALECSIASQKPQKIRISADIFEDEGRSPATGELVGAKLAKHLDGTFDVLAGTNTVRLEAPWPDAVTWELDRPHLYNCAVTLSDESGAACETVPKFVLGFREVWREGKEIMLNGHVQRYRGFWPGGGSPRNIADIKRFGFNCVFSTHQHESRYAMDPKQMEALSRAGIAMIGATPAISVVRAKIKSDPECRSQFTDYAARWARSARNWPCLHGASVGVNMMCAASFVMGARDFGRHRTATPESKDTYGGIGVACSIAQSLHPNCLYFAHGDGNTYDVGTCNFYFNWTPLQEREEWLSCWNAIGEIPCYPAEFGAPYYGSWFPQPAHSPAMTELCAIYFGERAYAEEDERMLVRSRDFAYSSAGNFYGGWANAGPEKNYSLFDFNPVGKELHTLFVERVTRTWRAWGQAISPMYLDSWDWNPAPDNWELEAHRRANGNVLCFIGGRTASDVPRERNPRFADKTHAYRSGETVRKVLCHVWDGLSDNVFKADWKASDPEGRVIASGKTETPMKPGEIRFVPFEFQAPPATRRTSLRIEARFDARGIDDTVATDSFNIEVHPAQIPLAVPAGKSVALFDPRGESGPVLDFIGVPYRQVASLDELAASSASHLVIGRRALDKIEPGAKLERLANPVIAGRRVMLMAQYPSTWQKLGFKIEDAMPRQLWNESLAGIDERDLSFWRGFPLPMRDGGAWQYGPDWGHVQEQSNGSRQWRWTHNHSLAAVVFQVPQRTLFRPLVKGEFDLMYSPLMRATAGQGALTVCSFDFEGRLTQTNDCPAAAAVAKATFADFLADASAAGASAYTDGATAARLAKCLGLDARPWTGGKLDDAVLILGDDSTRTFSSVTSALGPNAHVLVIDCERFVEDAGFALFMPKTTTVSWTQKKKEYLDPATIKRHVVSPGDIGDLGGSQPIDLDEEKPALEFKPKNILDWEIPRTWTCVTNVDDASYFRTRDVAAFGKFPFRGVGPQHLRWRFNMRVRRMKPQVGWTVAGDGVFAVSDNGKIVIDMLKPFLLTDQRKERKDPFGLWNVALSQDNQMRRHSLVLANWGVRPADSLLSRALTIVPQPKKGEKAPDAPSLYWSECPNYDPYWFCYW